MTLKCGLPVCIRLLPVKLPVISWGIPCDVPEHLVEGGCGLESRHKRTIRYGMTLVKKKGCGALYSQARKIRRERHLHILLEQLRKIECAQSHILCHFGLGYIIGKILDNIVTCGMDISPSGLGCFLKLRKILILRHHIFTKLKQDIINEHLASGLGEMVPAP